MAQANGFRKLQGAINEKEANGSLCKQEAEYFYQAYSIFKSSSYMGVKDMNGLVFFDTETTGIPNWKIMSEDPSQPHLCQLAALRVDPDTQETKQSMDVIIKPDGWIIEPEMTEIHGITTEHALDVGIPEKEALGMFLAFHEGCEKRIAYNTTFDNRIIRIATKRYSVEAVIDKWKSDPYECAMQLSRKVMGGKNPKLEDAFKHFMGDELINAHNALADTNACMAVYFAAKAQLNAEAA